jgi:hypothetical protein
VLIAKFFLPISSPGLAAIGLGLLATVKGAYNLIEVVAIVIGLLVVAVAGVFTIRSNVAKIWREQAEGEKARVADLTQQLAEQAKEHASLMAAAALEHSDKIAALRAEMTDALASLTREATEQRELKHKALAELAAANMRTDLTPLLTLLSEQHTAILTEISKIQPRQQEVSR